MRLSGALCQVPLLSTVQSRCCFRPVSPWYCLKYDLLAKHVVQDSSSVYRCHRCTVVQEHTWSYKFICYFISFDSLADFVSLVSKFFLFESHPASLTLITPHARYFFTVRRRCAFTAKQTKHALTTHTPAQSVSPAPTLYIYALSQINLQRAYSAAI